MNKTTYFITLERENSNTPKAIPQKAWDALCAELYSILHHHNSPLELAGPNHMGTVMVDSNFISFSPEDKEVGKEFILKRVGSKVLVSIKSNSKEYNTVVGACLLSIKKYVPGVMVSNSGGNHIWDSSIKYYEFVIEKNAPIIYSAQARKVTLTFEWRESSLSEDCDSTLEDIRSLLSSNAKNIKIKFDK